MKIDNLPQRLIVVLVLSTWKPAGKKRGIFLAVIDLSSPFEPLFSAC